MKINLADITTIDSYSEELSILEYETISSSINNLSHENALITVLQTIKENRNLFVTIIRKEIGFLGEPLLNNELTNDEIENKDASLIISDENKTLLEKCILLKKMQNIFDDVAKVEHIIVYNSLTDSIPEQKAMSFFNDEMITLRNIVREEVKSFMTQHQSITRNDVNFEIIKKISFELSDLIVKLNKFSKDSMRKSAKDFLSEKSLEEQMLFFQLFITEHFPKGFMNHSNMLPYHKSDDSVIDAEIDDGEKPTDSILELMEDTFSKFSNQIENLDKKIDENIKDRNIVDSEFNKFLESVSSEINKSAKRVADENLLELKEEVNEIKENIKELSTNFNDFIENQTKFTKLIKARYNLDELDNN